MFFFFINNGGAQKDRRYVWRRAFPLVFLNFREPKGVPLSTGAAEVHTKRQWSPHHLERQARPPSYQPPKDLA